MPSPRGERDARQRRHRDLAPVAAVQPHARQPHRRVDRFDQHDAPVLDMPARQIGAALRHDRASIAWARRARRRPACGWARPLRQRVPHPIDLPVGIELRLPHREQFGERAAGDRPDIDAVVAVAAGLRDAEEELAVEAAIGRQDRLRLVRQIEDQCVLVLRVAKPVPEQLMAQLLRRVAGRRVDRLAVEKARSIGMPRHRREAAFLEHVRQVGAAGEIAHAQALPVAAGGRGQIRDAPPIQARKRARQRDRAVGAQPIGIDRACATRSRVSWRQTSVPCASSPRWRHATMCRRSAPARPAAGNPSPGAGRPPPRRAPAVHQGIARVRAFCAVAHATVAGASTSSSGRNGSATATPCRVSTRSVRGGAIIVDSGIGGRRELHARHLADERLGRLIARQHQLHRPRPGLDQHDEALSARVTTLASTVRSLLVQVIAHGVGHGSAHLERAAPGVFGHRPQLFLDADAAGCIWRAGRSATASRS